MSGVDPNSPAGQAIAKQIDCPGNYSISQLYADFQSEQTCRLSGARIQWLMDNYSG